MVICFVASINQKGLHISVVIKILVKNFGNILADGKKPHFALAINFIGCHHRDLINLQNRKIPSLFFSYLFKLKDIYSSE